MKLPLPGLLCSLAAFSLAVSSHAAVDNKPEAPLASWIVTNSVPSTNEISFKEFLNEVAQANLDYAAQRYNVSIAKAAVAISKEFPNPVLSLNGSKDVRNWNRNLPNQNGQLVSQRMPEPVGVGVVQTIEYPGKRKWRIRTANSNYRAAAATVEDFARNLKVDASEAYVQALAAQRAFEQQRKASEYLNQLVTAQQHRLKAGDIGEVDLTQSRIDALQAQSDLLNTENDARTAQIALSGFLGRDRGQATLIPRGELEQKTRAFDQSQLLLQALQNRPDLVALRHFRDSASQSVSLAKANRMPDVDVGLNYTYTSASENFVAPAEHDSMVGLSFSFPLPLWNRQHAEIQTAHDLAAQAEKTVQSAELKAEVQVREALTTYLLMQERVQNFRSELLKGADKVLAAKRFSYEHGQATLLDLLDAQRADNTIQQSYNDALADAAKALIELERAAGLWDVEF